MIFSIPPLLASYPERMIYPQEIGHQLQSKLCPAPLNLIRILMQNSHNRSAWGDQVTQPQHDSRNSSSHTGGLHMFLTQDIKITLRTSVQYALSNVTGDLMPFLTPGMGCGCGLPLACIPVKPGAQDTGLFAPLPRVTTKAGNCLPVSSLPTLSLWSGTKLYTALFKTVHVIR